MSKASEMLAKGRAGLILDLPFFGSLALKLKLKEFPAEVEIPGKKKRRRTASTDGEHLWYEPEWIENLSLDEVKGVLCHEVMHCANQHHLRRDSRDMRKWVLACDYAINPLIIEAGLTLPAGGLNDPRFHNMSAEQIYSKLPEPDDDDDDDDPGNCGNVEDAPGKDGGPASADEKSQAAQDWNVAVVQAATQAKAMGNLPAGAERLLDKILNPKVDWREALRRFVNTAARNDYQWFPPNRRHIHNGFYLPSVRSEELGTVVTAIDTSGSIGKDELNQFAAELTSILEEYKTDCTVIYCDADVAKVEHILANDLPLRLKPRGGGGTDFRPPFKHVAEHEEVPACLVYFTDGYCDSFPEEEPSYPVIWIVTEGNAGFQPPFGEVIHI